MAGSPIKRQRRLAQQPIDPLDEPAPVAPRPELRGLVPHNKVGLSPENRAKVIEALAEGYPKAAIARALRVTTKTLSRLIQDDPELMEAVEAQRSFEEAELRDILMENARRGDTVAAIFLAKARHGWRDRDDPKLKVEAQGGVLVLPAAPATEAEWEARASANQAKYREGDPRTDPYAPGADRLRADAQKGAIRTRTLLQDGLAMQRLLPGDEPK